MAGDSYYYDAPLRTCLINPPVCDGVRYLKVDLTRPDDVPNLSAANEEDGIATGSPVLLQEEGGKEEEKGRGLEVPEDLLLLLLEEERNEQQEDLQADLIWNRFVGSARPLPLVTSTEDGQVRCEVKDVPSPTVGFWVAEKGGMEKKDLWWFRHLGVQVKFIQDHRGSQDDDTVIAVITGPNVHALTRACAHLRALERRVMPYTHFLSLPLFPPNSDTKPEGLVHQQATAAAFEEFYTLALGGEGGTRRRLPSSSPPQFFNASIFKPVSRLHLTLAMLRLSTKRRRRAFTAALKEMQGCLYDALGTRSLLVELEGLGYMGDDPSAVRVVYTKPKSQLLPTGIDMGFDSRVQNMAAVLFRQLILSEFFPAEELIRQRLIDTGLKGVNINLHVTLCNVKFYRPDDNEAVSTYTVPTAPRVDEMQRTIAEMNPSTTQRQERKKDKKHKGKTTCNSFDGTWLLKEFATYPFGKFRLKELHVSSLTDMDKRRDYYQPLFKMVLP